MNLLHGEGRELEDLAMEVEVLWLFRSHLTSGGRKSSHDWAAIVQEKEILRVKMEAEKGRRRTRGDEGERGRCKGRKGIYCLNLWIGP